MTLSSLGQIPRNGRVFLDSSIFIYHATRRSEECRSLLRRVEAGDVAGVTSTHVLAEVAHRLMTIEAVRAGVVTGKNVVKKLRENPAIVRGLSLYQEQVEQIPLMGVDIIPLDLAALLHSAEIRRRYGLLVNDSLVAAAAVGAQLELLASADRDFSRVEVLHLYRPSDLS